jgi:hypothetical protein
MPTITRTNVNLEHPYRTIGIIVVLLSFGVLAFSLGVLARCGGGEGLCLDAPTHGAADAGLVTFVVTFVIGIALIAYTGATASFQTTTPTPKAATPTVTNVYAQPATPRTTVMTVSSETPAPVAAPATTVVMTPQ